MPRNCALVEGHEVRRGRTASASRHGRHSCPSHFVLARGNVDDHILLPSPAALDSLFRRLHIVDERLAHLLQVDRLDAVIPQLCGIVLHSILRLFTTLFLEIARNMLLDYGTSFSDGSTKALNGKDGHGLGKSHIFRERQQQLLRTAKTKTRLRCWHVPCSWASMISHRTSLATPCKVKVP